MLMFFGNKSAHTNFCEAILAAQHEIVNLHSLDYQLSDCLEF